MDLQILLTPCVGLDSNITIADVSLFISYLNLTLVISKSNVAVKTTQKLEPDELFSQ